MKRSPLHIILFVTLADLIGFGLIIPLQAVYAERLGASGLTFGLLIGVYAAMQFIFNPILGRWSDRVGRRRVLLLSVAGTVGSHLLLGVSDLMHSLPLLFLARILDGVTGANIATAQAYIADVTTTENRAKGMGLFGAAFGLGFVIGPALGAGLAAIGRRVSGEYGTAWPAFGATVIAATAVVLIWRFLPESIDKRTVTDQETTRRRYFSLAGFRSAMKQPLLRELISLTFVLTFAFVLLEATFVYLCKKRLGLREEGTGLLFAYIGLVMVIVQGGLVGRLVPRFGEMRLLGVGPFLTALGFVLIAGVAMTPSLRTAWVLIIVGCLFVPLGHGLTGPNLNAVISRVGAARRHGTTFGLAQGIASLARAISPPFAGFLFDLGPQWPYLLGAVLLTLTGGFALRLGRIQRQLLAPSEQAGRSELEPVERPAIVDDTARGA